jgi:hypothetical protein
MDLNLGTQAVRMAAQSPTEDRERGVSEGEQGKGNSDEAKEDQRAPEALGTTSTRQGFSHHGEESARGVEGETARTDVRTRCADRDDRGKDLGPAGSRTIEDPARGPSAQGPEEPKAADDSEFHNRTHKQLALCKRGTSWWVKSYVAKKRALWEKMLSEIDWDQSSPSQSPPQDGPGPGPGGQGDEDRGPGPMPPCGGASAGDGERRDGTSLGSQGGSQDEGGTSGKRRAGSHDPPKRRRGASADLLEGEATKEESSSDAAQEVGPDQGSRARTGKPQATKTQTRRRKSAPPTLRRLHKHFALCKEGAAWWAKNFATKKRALWGATRAELRIARTTEAQSQEGAGAQEGPAEDKQQAESAKPRMKRKRTLSVPQAQGPRKSSAAQPDTRQPRSPDRLDCDRSRANG